MFHSDQFFERTGAYYRMENLGVDHEEAQERLVELPNKFLSAFLLTVRFFQ